MINRENWKLVKAYIKYRLEVDQLSISSMRLEETWLRHLLEWAGNVPFVQSPKIRPTFPEYLLLARLDGEKKKLSPIYTKKVVKAAHRYFSWVRTHRRGFSVISHIWLDTLKPPRITTEPKDHEAVTFEEVRAIAGAEVYSIRDRRIRASAVFWFLSGIRIGAFVSLPISAVDLENLTILQWPKLGVKTKFSKHATTYLLNIPDLVDLVKEWDQEVRSCSEMDGLWFAPVSPETGEVDPTIKEAGEHRDSRARKDLKEWLNRVNLPYHSPHKFRHGHAVYALKKAKEVSALKAVSQNLMHSNLSITDGVYGILSETDVREQIAALGKNLETNLIQDYNSIVPILEQILSNIKERDT